MILRQNKAIRYAITAVALVVLTAAAMAADNPVVGTWECVSLTPDGDELHSTLTVTEADGKLAATLVGDDGDWTVSKVKFEDKVLSFTVTRDADYEITMNLNGDKLDGKWSGGGMEGKMTATRRKA